MEEAIAELTELPEADQNAIAAWLLEWTEPERRWEKLFAENNDALGRLADEALAEHEESRNLELDAENL